MGNFFWITLWEKGFELDIELKQTFCLQTPKLWLYPTATLCREHPKVKLGFRSLTRMNFINATLNSSVENI